MIYTDLTGLAFDSNNGVVDLTQQPGNYMVFVSEGERVLYIYKEGFKPLEVILYQYGISGLKSGQVYQLDVTAKDKEASKTLPVVFNVTPADAIIRVGSEVFVSGQVKELLMGTNEVIIEKEGYNAIKDNINVSRTNILFTYQLQKKEHVLVKISTNPSDATIYLNNKENGESPIELFLFPGTYDLKISKSQYLTVDELITVFDNSKNEFLYNLTKNTGVINFTLNPPNAQIIINNEIARNNNRLELVPGIYMIEIKADKHHSQKETIEIKLGDNIHKNYTLDAQTGNLLLSTNPVDTKTEIYINNNFIKTVIGSVQVTDLFIGDYTLKCSASGHKNKVFRVSVVENEFKEFSIVLEERADVVIEMVFVEGGTFQMGSNEGSHNEKPVHNVSVSSFYIGKYEVTQKEWVAVMGSNPSRFQRGKKIGGFLGIGGMKILNSDSLPVENISWYDAVEFCNKLSEIEGFTPVYTINERNVICDWNADGYRLPTEAEWEFAARGGNKSKGFKYSGSNNINEVAWYGANSGKITHIVGTKQPNELGLYDMSGNVWEWCWNWLDPYTIDRKTNPIGNDTGLNRIKRGGSNNQAIEYSTVSYRDSYNPVFVYKTFGFRPVRSIKE